jgi:hypothetical protein
MTAKTPFGGVCISVIQFTKYKVTEFYKILEYTLGNREWNWFVCLDEVDTFTMPLE